jgi:NhaP-type Na+/H+ or K+/H+ antiporter
MRLPSILLLLAFGVALGSFVRPDELSLGPKLLFPIVSLSVAVILFEGGLSLRLNELKEAARVVMRLVTFGALISWGLTALAAWQILNLDLKVSALIGAILVVTGPTVVAPLLRTIRPTRRIGAIVKWEGIVIDPIGAILAVLVYEQVFLEHDHTSKLTALPATRLSSRCRIPDCGTGCVCGE